MWLKPVIMWIFSLTFLWLQWLFEFSLEQSCSCIADLEHFWSLLGPCPNFVKPESTDAWESKLHSFHSSHVTISVNFSTHVFSHLTICDRSPIRAANLTQLLLYKHWSCCHGMQDDLEWMVRMVFIALGVSSCLGTLTMGALLVTVLWKG